MRAAGPPAAGSPATAIMTAVGLMLLAGAANCASSLSEIEPASSRSPQVVGLAPLPPSSPPPSAPTDAAAAAPPHASAEQARPESARRDVEAAPAVPAAPRTEFSSAACGARIGAHVIKRAALLRTLDAGLGTWLRGIDVEGKLDHGHFQGWLVRSIYPGDPCWADIDLRAGDVVTRINRHGIERPEEAQAVWTSLRTSGEILVEVIRGGRARTLRFAIADGPEEPFSGGPSR